MARRPLGRHDERLLRRLGARVRALREEAGVSQEQLAELCDLHRTYVGAVERGERNLSVVNVAKIARALRVRASDLLLDVDA